MEVFTHAPGKACPLAIDWLPLSFLIALPAYLHGGGFDAYVCHHNRKLGGYHCHRGPLAGQSFASKEEMLERLKSKGDKASQPSPGEKTRRQLSP